MARVARVARVAGVAGVVGASNVALVMASGDEESERERERERESAIGGVAERRSRGNGRAVERRWGRRDEARPGPVPSEFAIERPMIRVCVL